MLMYVYMHIIDFYISEAAYLEIYLLLQCTIKGWRPLVQVTQKIHF